MDTSPIRMDDMFDGADAMTHRVTHPKPPLKKAIPFEEAGEEKEAAVSKLIFESVADQNQK